MFDLGVWIYEKFSPIFTPNQTHPQYKKIKLYKQFSSQNCCNFLLLKYYTFLKVSIKMEASSKRDKRVRDGVAWWQRYSELLLINHVISFHMIQVVN